MRTALTLALLLSLAPFVHADEIPTVDRLRLDIVGSLVIVMPDGATLPCTTMDLARIVRAHMQAQVKAQKERAAKEQKEVSELRAKVEKLEAAAPVPLDEPCAVVEPPKKRVDQCVAGP